MHFPAGKTDAKRDKLSPTSPCVCVRRRDPHSRAVTLFCSMMSHTRFSFPQHDEELLSTKFWLPSFNLQVETRCLGKKRLRQARDVPVIQDFSLCRGKPQAEIKSA